MKRSHPSLTKHFSSHRGPVSAALLLLIFLFSFWKCIYMKTLDSCFPSWLTMEMGFGVSSKCVGGISQKHGTLGAGISQPFLKSSDPSVQEQTNCSSFLHRIRTWLSGNVSSAPFQITHRAPTPWVFQLWHWAPSPAAKGFLFLEP